MFIKYVVLFPIAAIWDSVTFFFENGTRAVKYVDGKMSSKFDKVVEWCERRD